MLKYVFLLKRVLYVQIENTLLLRVLFMYFLFLILASINSILSKFGGALRYIVGCLIIPFLFLIKCYAVTTTTTATGELCATWEPRGTTISNFSAVFMCVLVIFFVYSLVMFQHKKARFLIRFLCVYFFQCIFFFVSPPALIDFECVLIRVPLS